MAPPVLDAGDERPLITDYDGVDMPQVTPVQLYTQNGRQCLTLPLCNLKADGTCRYGLLGHNLWYQCQ
jgi:hypothetical protein